MERLEYLTGRPTRRPMGGSGVTWVGPGAVIDTNQLKITPTEGAELATGTLTVGTWYKITATETNHFYTGSAINDTFRATATTALDANNKVLPLSDLFALADLGITNIYGGCIFPAFTERTQRGLILRADSLTNPQNFILCYRDGAGNIKVTVLQGFTQYLKTTANAFSANEEWRVLLRGINIRLHKFTASMADVTTAVVAGNFHGLFSTDASSRFDTLVIWPFGSWRGSTVY